MAKNLILWLIIAAVLVTVMNNFSSPNEPQTLNYSDFIQQVKDGKVERVAVDGYVITGKRNDGDSFKTIRPAIQDNGLQVFFQPIVDGGSGAVLALEALARCIGGAVTLVEHVVAKLHGLQRARAPVLLRVLARVGVLEGKAVGRGGVEGGC